MDNIKTIFYCQNLCFELKDQIILCRNIFYSFQNLGNVKIFFLASMRDHKLVQEIPVFFSDEKHIKLEIVAKIWQFPEFTESFRIYSEVKLFKNKCFSLNLQQKFCVHLLHPTYLIMKFRKFYLFIFALINYQVKGQVLGELKSLILGGQTGSTITENLLRIVK